MDSQVILETALRRKEVSAIEALMLLQDASAGSSQLSRVANSLNEGQNENTVTYVRSKKGDKGENCLWETS